MEELNKLQELKEKLTTAKQKIREDVITEIKAGVSVVKIADAAGFHHTNIYKAQKDGRMPKGGTPKIPPRRERQESLKEQRILIIDLEEAMWDTIKVALEKGASVAKVALATGKCANSLGRMVKAGKLIKKEIKKPRLSDTFVPQNFRVNMLESLLEKHGLICQGCDREFDHERYLEIDHLVPRSKGGSNDLENLTLLCHPCNINKGSRFTLSELREDNERIWFMKGQIKPDLTYIESMVNMLPAGEFRLHEIISQLGFTDKTCGLNSKPFRKICSSLRSAGWVIERRCYDGESYPYWVSPVGWQEDLSTIISVRG